MEKQISLYKLFGKFMGKEIILPEPDSNSSSLKAAQDTLKEIFNPIDQIAAANNLTTRRAFGKKPLDIGLDPANAGRVNIIVDADTTGQKRIVEIALG